MPRFYFNVHDGRTIPDDTGVKLTGLKEAQLLALHRAASLLKTDEIFWIGHDWLMDVEDQDGKVLFTLSFSMADLEQLGKIADA